VFSPPIQFRFVFFFCVLSDIMFFIGKKRTPPFRVPALIIIFIVAYFREVNAGECSFARRCISLSSCGFVVVEHIMKKASDDDV
jgi:hypothetical protein